MANKAKYELVESTIKAEINSGALAVGDQLMTEEELCERFNFSRTTVGKALDNLRAHGYIERIPGKGTFVKAVHIDKNAGSGSSFSDDMAQIGLKAGAKLISYQIVRAAEVPDIARKLKVDDTEALHYFVRLRSGNGRPIAIGYTYVSSSVIPAIDIKSLDHSFYDYLHSLGMDVFSREIKYSATLPTEEQKRLLDADNIALLRSAHVSYTTLKDIATPFEYTETYFNGDMYSYAAHSARA